MLSPSRLKRRATAVLVIAARGASPWPGTDLPTGRSLCVQTWLFGNLDNLEAAHRQEGICLLRKCVRQQRTALFDYQVISPRLKHLWATSTTAGAILHVRGKRSTEFGWIALAQNQFRNLADRAKCATRCR